MLQIHGDVVPTSIAHTVPHDNTTPILPLNVVKRLADVSLPDDSNPANQTTTERPRIPVTSPDPVTAGAIRDIVDLSTPPDSLDIPSDPVLDDIFRCLPSPDPTSHRLFQNLVVPNELPLLLRALFQAFRPSGPASAGDTGAAAEAGSKSKPGLRKAALDPPR
ncbi:hypothetical protein EDB87DRAFT_1682261 [Lactarius vividus]|nr:hypothetical protein EDB87DRAFT_1682261 [Lactarius vividus]